MPSYREHCLGETLEQTHRYLFMVYKGRQPPMDTCNSYKFVAAIKVLTLEFEGVISVTSLKAKLLHTIVRGAGVRLSHGNDWMTSTSWNIVEAVWHSRIILNVIIKCTRVVYILLKLPFFFRCKDVLLTGHHFYSVNSYVGVFYIIFHFVEYMFLKTITFLKDEFYSF